MTSQDVTEINVAYPEASDLQLRITVGACRLKIKPGEGDAWITGSYEDPTGKLPAKILQEGGTVRITQSHSWTDILGWFGGVPTFDLALGKVRPYTLALESGASENKFDLGGLPISRLVAKQGAGKMEIDFSAPNTQAMSLLNLGAGAAGMELRNLANANFAEMSVDGGAAAYKFDFGGTLQRNAHVKISTGMSSVEIRVPAATAAKITSESLVGGLDIGDGFTKKEGAFWTQGALAGNTPVLTIHTSVALGALRLRTT
jgi:hypothetical protein